MAADGFGHAHSGWPRPLDLSSSGSCSGEWKLELYSNQAVEGTMAAPWRHGEANRSLIRQLAPRWVLVCGLVAAFVLIGE